MEAGLQEAFQLLFSASDDFASDRIYWVESIQMWFCVQTGNGEENFDMDLGLPLRNVISSLRTPLQTQRNPCLGQRLERSG